MQDLQIGYAVTPHLNARGGYCSTVARKLTAHPIGWESVLPSQGQLLASKQSGSNSLESIRKRSRFSDFRKIPPSW
jgi:hypothetical protein